jgi:Fe2+ or Zn2+ uptake regulation protein
MNDSAKLKEELKDRGYKLTRQREALLDALGEVELPATAQELFERVIKKDPGINFSTVYRNLEILVEEGLVLQVERGREASYYELKQPEKHYHHLICKGCGSIQKTDFCPFKNMPPSKDFVATEHRFEIYGFCKQCMQDKELDDED